MSILYINPLLSSLQFIVFDTNFSEITRLTQEKGGNEFSTFPEFLITSIQKYNIEEIWCVNGPGPFTLMRIVTLTINSVAYGCGIRIKSCTFFELVSASHTGLIEINLREYLLLDANNKMISMQKDELPPGMYEGIFNKIDFVDGRFFVNYTDTVTQILSVFTKKSEETFLSPIYFKPPNITCSTKIM